VVGGGWSKAWKVGQSNGALKVDSETVTRLPFHQQSFPLDVVVSISDSESGDGSSILSVGTYFLDFWMVFEEVMFGFRGYEEERGYRVG
jgi:hypothetical protein